MPVVGAEGGDVVEVTGPGVVLVEEVAAPSSTASAESPSGPSAGDVMALIMIRRPSNSTGSPFAVCTNE